ncbi:PRK06851 family protein [Salibacterium aidingense]|uniref:PRK06851 family protein n=1 Tax=Salibacterium aidingense TaxID=384933 RepID=UPI003BE3E190
MSEKVLHYYAGDHTAKGFYPLYASNFQGLERIFILKGSSAAIKTDILTKLADIWKSRNYELEVIHSSSDNDNLDGIIIPYLKIGVHGGTSDPFEPKEGTIEIVDVDATLDSKHLERQQNRIQRYQKKIKKSFQSAHQSFQTGLRIHDDLEDIYIRHLDSDKADQAAEDVGKHLFSNEEPKEKTPLTKHRFFGASTPKGVVDYIPNIIDDLEKRYFIKGRAGTGKSTFLKKQAEAAQDLGLDVEIYHCGFDPESIDMVVVRELGFCIFDSTDPHEYFPETKNDEIIDLYEKTVAPGTDEKYANTIHDLTRMYKSYMKKGITHLKKAKQDNDNLEKIYLAASDDSTLNHIFDTLKKQVEIQENLIVQKTGSLLD